MTLINQNTPRDFGSFIGTSPVMQRIYTQIEAASSNDAAVFITGPSGTGKNICAEAVHKYSPRRAKPFVTINCAALPADMLEMELFGHLKIKFDDASSDHSHESHGAISQADGGTLFLDEIASMPVAIQARLLQFLKSFQYIKPDSTSPVTADVRIICATNRAPQQAINDGELREDLYYHLNVLPIYMPPLQKRGEDVIDLAQIFLRYYAEIEKRSFTGFTEEAENLLRHYHWPGNIRQLENTIRRAVIMYDGPLVTNNMLPDDILQNASAHNTTQPLPPNPREIIKPLAVEEREIIERAINLCGGHIPRAAAALGVAPSTIYRKKAEWDRSEIS